MQYNMGEAKFNENKWPSLFKNIKAQDWGKAAEEANSPDVGEDRNKWLKDLFKNSSK